MNDAMMNRYKVVELKDSALLGKEFKYGSNCIYPMVEVVRVSYSEANGTLVDVKFHDGTLGHGVNMDIINLQNK